jgi:hypothetical protein
MLYTTNLNTFYSSPNCKFVGRVYDLGAFRALVRVRDIIHTIADVRNLSDHLSTLARR